MSTMRVAYGYLPYQQKLSLRRGSEWRARSIFTSTLDILLVEQIGIQYALGIGKSAFSERSRQLTETNVPGKKSIDTIATARMFALSCIACLPTFSLQRAFC